MTVWVNDIGEGDVWVKEEETENHLVYNCQVYVSSVVATLVLCGSNRE